MRSLLRLAVAALLGYLATRLLGHAPYWALVPLTFLAEGIGAGVTRELLVQRNRSLSDLFPDLFWPVALAVLMLLAVRAFSPGEEPSALLPGLVWPLVDLWRPLGRSDSD